MGGNCMTSLYRSHVATRHAFRLIKAKLGSKECQRRQLNQAVFEGDIKEVEEILSIVEVNIDVAPLEIASLKGHYDITQLLLEKHNFSHKTGLRALNLSVWKGHVEVMKLLINAGFDYHERNIYGETLLYVAACGNQAEIIDELIAQDCDVDERTRGCTPLHVAAQRNHTEALKCLLKHGCNTNIRNRENHSPLHLALSNGHFLHTNYLLKVGSKVNMNELHQMTYITTQLNRHPKIEELLQKELCEIKLLIYLCRREIRKILGKSLIKKIKELPLPSVLKNFVRMEEEFSVI